jgi:hypothetical protein
MPQGLQALLALLVLLPGFVSARLVRMMSARSQQTELERVTEALIFSFFISVVYIALFGVSLPLEWSSTISAVGVQHFAVVVHRWRVVALGVLSILLGFGWGVVKGRDLLLRLLRYVKLTERTSRESVWNDVFLSLGGSVQIELADGRMLVGWLARYSDTGDERSLFLEQASWIDEDGKTIPIPGSGILLTEKSEIHFVMFLDESTQNAKTTEAPIVRS